MNFPKGLKYTEEHEWVRLDGNIATVGITDFAQSELGELVFIEVETEGDQLNLGEVFGTVEAVKTVSDLFMPVSGTITTFNSAIEDAPELVNSDPYGEGWIIKIEVSDLEELGALMDVDAYKTMVA